MSLLQADIPWAVTSIPVSCLSLNIHMNCIFFIISEVVLIYKWYLNYSILKLFKSISQYRKLLIEEEASGLPCSIMCPWHLLAYFLRDIHGMAWASNFYSYSCPWWEYWTRWSLGFLVALGCWQFSECWWNPGVGSCIRSVSHILLPPSFLILVYNREF